MSDGYEDSDGKAGSDAIEKDEIDLPNLYKVLLHNDDYTTMEFVIHILTAVFGKTANEAMQIMWMVHEEGVGICGLYVYEIAESKQQRVLREAKENGFPLKCSIEVE